jgi:hypothetical protein
MPRRSDDDGPPGAPGSSEGHGRPGADGGGRARQGAGGGGSRRAGGAQRRSGGERGAGRRRADDARTPARRRARDAGRGGRSGREGGAGRAAGRNAGGAGGQERGPAGERTGAPGRRGRPPARRAPTGRAGGWGRTARRGVEQAGGRWVEEPSAKFTPPDGRRADRPAARRPALRTVGEPRQAPQARRAPAAKGRPARRRRPETEASAELRDLAGRGAERAVAQLQAAAEAFADGRERETTRLLRPLRDRYPEAAAVRELLGLAQYRLGNFNAAARELEAFADLTGSTEQHPVLMDCYRAQRRYGDVEALWAELRDASPSSALVSEGRIVAAGALADQGDVRGAIRLLERRAGDVRRAREHHLRLWYALGDLLERAGELPAARTMFERVARHQPSFADVAERLAAL